MKRLGYRVVRVSAAEVMAAADDVADGIVQMALALIGEAAGARPCAPSVTAQEKRRATSAARGRGRSRKYSNPSLCLFTGEVALDALSRRVTEGAQGRLLDGESP